MVLNGPRAHPLFKYLKKNCDQFYNYNTNSADKKLNESIGMFLVQPATGATPIHIVYYN